MTFGNLKRLGLVLFCIVLLQGCATLDYYFSAIGGHLDLVSRERPVEEVIESPTVDPELKSRLQLALKIREFASREMFLPDNDSYRSYADLERPYAVWNVIAAPPLSVEAKKWCFLFAGCISYRGYFSKQKAELFAQSEAESGLDVHVAGARAYSTLGWFDDPLLNTMLDLSEARFIGIIFHELAHQKIYIKDDSTFNESFATTVEREGVRRWYLSQSQPKKHQAYLKQIRRDLSFKKLLLETRENLKSIYARSLPNEEKLKLKNREFSSLKKRYQIWKQKEGGYGGYDTWMNQALNNSHLALVATYHEYVPAFQRILQAESSSLEAFYKLVEELGDLQPEIRRKRLTLLAAKP